MKTDHYYFNGFTPSTGARALVYRSKISAAPYDFSGPGTYTRHRFFLRPGKYQSQMGVAQGFAGVQTQRKLQVPGGLTGMRVAPPRPGYP